MDKDVETLKHMYARFNARDIDGVLAALTDDVAWANGMEGGHVHGRKAVRDYWTRQWAEFDPHVDPLTITEKSGGTFHVRVHQLVKSLHGDILADSEVIHIFTVTGGLISAMDLGNEAEASAAFSHHS